MAEEAEFNIKIAQDTQSKLEFYAIALTFTVLGLSVQTSAFGRNLVADGLELLGWVSLLVSGMVGLSRVESMPHVYKLYALHRQYDELSKYLRKVQHQNPNTPTMSLTDGEVLPVSTALANAEKSVTTINEEIEPATGSLVRRYKVQRTLFIAGMTLLLLGRGYIAAVRIVLEIARAASA
jgi:hypothetical protein